MKKLEQEIFWWVILGIPLVMSILMFFFGETLNGSLYLTTSVLLTVGCFIFSFTEHGPASQLPNNTCLRVKSGEMFVGYYVNAENTKVDHLGNIDNDTDGVYQKRLRSGLSGLVFQMTGMVYTRLPFINGIRGMVVTQTELDFTKEEDGSVAITVKVVDKRYHRAIPIFVRRGISYGGIPIEGKNLIDIGIASTLKVTNINDFGTKFANNSDSNMIALKGTFESALRPKIDMLSLDQVLKMRSEYHTTRGRIISPQERANSPVLQAIDEANVATKTYRYGVAFHDLDMPVIAPGDKEFAKAERKKALNEALASANTVEFENDAKKIRTLGSARADARKNLLNAGGNPNMALWAEGLGSIQPNVTVVLGNGGVPVTLPIDRQGQRQQQKPKEGQK